MKDFLNHRNVLPNLSLTVAVILEEFSKDEADYEVSTLLCRYKRILLKSPVKNLAHLVLSYFAWERR